MAVLSIMPLCPPPIWMWNIVASTIIILGSSARAVQPPSSWSVLGPLPLGMREIGDPLGAYGGIFGIPHGGSKTYPSELGEGGRIGWTTEMADAQGRVHISYQHQYDSSFLQGPYGWSILMWQGWAVGEFEVNESGRFLMQCLNTKEVYIDSEVNFFPGDWYAYGYMYTPVTLSAGKHSMYVKLESSVRAFGNTPNISFACQFTEVNGEIVAAGAGYAAVAPDIVNGHLASPHFALPIINGGTRWLKRVFAVSNTNGVSITPKYLDIAPGQTSLLSFFANSSSTLGCPFSLSISVMVENVAQLQYTFPLACSTFGSTPYKFTFLDFDQSVQYAAAIPPKNSCGSTCSLVVASHGAGVEAGDPFWTSAFIQQDKAWILFPTGRRPWGFDWHGASMKNVFRSVEYLTTSLPGVPAQRRSEFGIAPKHILWTGHSMGGAGCWLLATHFPDLAIAAAPVAGFISIEKYVPFDLHLGYSHMDPFLKGVLQSSITEYDSDIYSSNLVGVPLLARYGSLDNNVPPWNSRRNARLVEEHSHDANAVQVSEVPGENHWWSSAMNGSEIQDFYVKHLSAGLPAFPHKFTAVSINADSAGSKGSIHILQFTVPGRLGSVHVDTSSGTWNLETHNVKRFGLVQDSRGPSKSIQVNGQVLPVVHLPSFTYCLLTSSSTWTTCNNTWTSSERKPGQNGPISKILEKPFTIVYGTSGTPSEKLIQWNYATFLANQWFLYSNGLVSIKADHDMQDDEVSSVVLIGGPATNSYARKLSESLQVPVQFSVDGTSWTISGIAFRGSSSSLGLQFIAPLDAERLVVFIAGTDAKGLKMSIDRFPIFSGITVPDWLVLDAGLDFQGDAAAIGAGHWGNNWEYLPQSSYHY